VTKRWFEESPWPELFEAGWENMSKENRQEFMRLSWYHHCKEEYERSLEWAGKDGPDWEDLTEEQRENVGKRIQENAQEMRELGKKIAKGDELDATLHGK